MKEGGKRGGNQQRLVDQFLSSKKPGPFQDDRGVTEGQKKKWERNLYSEQRKWGGS